MFTQTAGPFFSIGGVIANPSVHGSAFAAERLHKYATGFRVMLANGTIREISDAQGVKDWRGSMGLLGVMLAVQYDVTLDTGIEMDCFNVQFCAGSGLSCTNSYGGLMSSSPSVSYTAPPGFTPPPTWSGPYYGYGGAWSQSAINTYLNSIANSYDTMEMFYNPYTDELQALVMKFTGGSYFNYSATTSIYTQLVGKFSDLSKSGGQIRYDNAILSTLAATTENLELLGPIIMSQGMGITQSAWQGQNSGPTARRDGYFIPSDNLIPFNQLYIYAKCVTDCINDNLLFHMIDNTRTFLQNVINPASLSSWFPTLQVEFRIINIQSGTLTLEHLSAGKWIGFEIVNIAENTIYSNHHLTYFYNLEQIWKNTANVYGQGFALHHGKSWGTGPYSGMSPQYYFPFQNTSQTQNVYSSAVRSQFLSTMANYDPNALFAAGQALEMLNYPGYSVKFDPRKSMGARCLSGQDAECADSGAVCMANTCNVSPICSVFFPCPSGTTCDWGTCRQTGLPYAIPCNTNSQCSSNICCAGFCSDSDADLLPSGSLCTSSCQCASGTCFVLVCT